MAKGGYQKRRIQAKRDAAHQARRRAKRNKKILTALITAGIASMFLIAALAFNGGDKKPNFASSPSATPTPSPTITAPAPNPTPSLKFPTPCTAFEGAQGKTAFSNPPCKVIDESKTYAATFKTNLGSFTVDLFAAEAPVTVNNFVFLARAGFYDGTIWHRVIPDFSGKAMIQGGDAENRDGTGGPGYTFGDENMIPLDKPGYLAMANSGAGSNGSQFFVLEGTVGHLNAPGACAGPTGCHSVFGKVIKGLDIVGKIGAVKTGENDKPVKDVILQKVTITGS